MRILGLDPGSLRFGVAVLEKKGREVAFLHAETIRLPAGEFSGRMAALWERLDTVLDGHPVDGAALEEGFLGKNVRSMSLLCTTRGIAMGALLARKVPFFTYSPRAVKQSLTGNGNASKDQVQHMVQRVLKPGKTLAPDAADAVAVAYCHAVHTK